MSESEETTEASAQLHVWGTTFSVAGIGLSIQVSGMVCMTTAALVDFNDALIFATTRTEKFDSEEAMLEGLQEQPSKAIEKLRKDLIDEGMVLIGDAEVTL